MNTKEDANKSRTEGNMITKDKKRRKYPGIGKIGRNKGGWR